MERSISFRIRIGHSKTQRDGWGYETTVELNEEVGELDAAELEAISAKLDSLLRLAANRGEIERDRRERQIN